MSASMVDRVHCESLARWPGLEKKKVEGSSQQKCAECQSTAQGTSGHARPVSDDLQGGERSFGRFRWDQLHSASLQVYARGRVCARIRRAARVPTTALSCLLSHGERKKQHHKTNSNSTRNVDRTLIVATCGTRCIMIIISCSRPRVAIQ